jgi:hypothetical protein
MTYGTNAPIGLVPLRYLSGAPFNDATNLYPIVSGYATSIFKGDPVAWDTNGTIKIATAGSAILGVFWGVWYTQTTGIAPFTPANYWPASTVTANAGDAWAMVIDNPDVVYTIQETNGSGLAGTALTQTNVGQNFNFLVGSGTTLTGISTTSLNNASGAAGSDSAKNLKIIGFDPNLANPSGGAVQVGMPPLPATSGTAFQNWLVIINNGLIRAGVVGHS